METEKKYAPAEREKGRETKEKDMDAETRIAAVKERADYLVKEVKSNKKQMQNIVLHMQQVRQAIQNLRAQLQLADAEDSSSLAHDQDRVAQLKQQIQEYSGELILMREDLIREEMGELKREKFSGTEEEFRSEAQKRVGRLIQV